MPSYTFINSHSQVNNPGPKGRLVMFNFKLVSYTFTAVRLYAFSVCVFL